MALALPDLDLNQNLWGLLVTYTALGAAEHWGMERLACLAFVMAIVLSLSVLVTTTLYTYQYCVHKWVKARSELKP